MRHGKQLKYTNITAEEFSDISSVHRVLKESGGSCWFEVKDGMIFKLEEKDNGEPNLIYVCLSTIDEGVYYVF